MPNLFEIYLLPPFAIARLGSSAVPVDAYEWVENAEMHGGNQTIIHPSISLRVLSDGSVRPYLPASISFRDGPDAAIRPVAPFFELWARFDDSLEIKPLTSALLQSLGGTLADVSYRITAANLKAARRTHDRSCGFSADITVDAEDPVPKSLLAASPVIPGSEPLVFANAPIRLGTVQAIRPRVGTVLGVDLDVLRVRFTPADGQVYGPPSTTVAADPDDPGRFARQYEVVPARNRILNGAAAWSTFLFDENAESPIPPDTFDGANDAGGRGLGVVDDTCDLVILATVEIGQKRFSARARACSAPPDFAPDRRPFVSLADDLGDRELPELTPDQIKHPDTVREVADLLRRVFETVSLTNLDALRQQALGPQQTPAFDPVPHASAGLSMTKADVPLASQVPELLGDTPGDQHLARTDVAFDVHGDLADVENLIALLRREPDRVRHLLRPPYARLGDLPERPTPRVKTDKLKPGDVSAISPRERDVRVLRDQLHDMRMPPYMRDEEASPLSLTWRQHREIMALIDRLSKLDDAEFAAISPVRQHVARVVARRRAAGVDGSRGEERT